MELCEDILGVYSELWCCDLMYAHGDVNLSIYVGYMCNMILLKVKYSMSYSE